MITLHTITVALSTGEQVIRHIIRSKRLTHTDATRILREEGLSNDASVLRIETTDYAV
jgi:hypothetical protein